MPAAHPRRVHVSHELLANPDRAGYGDGFAAVVREFALGDELRPRMSTAIEHAYAPRGSPLLARRRRGRHLDRLLADWGIHHLHLHSEPHRKRPEFTRRSPHVLLSAIRPHDAYLIDIRAHESDGANWSELAIRETVVRNWPDAGILQAANYVTGLEGGNWSDEDRRALREAGVSTGIVEIDGRVWLASGQGLTGIPQPVGTHCMGVSWFLTGYQPTDNELRVQLSAMAAKHGVPDNWHGHVEGEDFGFVSAGVFAPYGCLVPVRPGLHPLHVLGQVEWPGRRGTPGSPAQRSPRQSPSRRWPPSARRRSRPRPAAALRGPQHGDSRSAARRGHLAGPAHVVRHGDLPRPQPPYRLRARAGQAMGLSKEKNASLRSPASPPDRRSSRIGRTVRRCPSWGRCRTSPRSWHAGIGGTREHPERPSGRPTTSVAATVRKLNS